MNGQIVAAAGRLPGSFEVIKESRYQEGRKRQTAPLALFTREQNLQGAKLTGSKTYREQNLQGAKLTGSKTGKKR
jgi:hypothetical protein